VREVLGTAGGVRAGRQVGRDGLPGRATVARVAARHLPLRDSHSFLLYQDRTDRSCVVILGRAGVVLRSLLVLRRPVVLVLLLLEGGEAGPAGVDRFVVRMVGVVRQSGATLDAQPGTVLHAQRLER